LHDVSARVAGARLAAAGAILGAFIGWFTAPRQWVGAELPSSQARQSPCRSAYVALTGARMRRSSIEQSRAKPHRRIATA